MEKGSFFPRLAFSGTALKRLACVSMLLDHIGSSCIESGVFGTDDILKLSVINKLFHAHPVLLVLDLILRAAGRLAFPIYCFLLVEGFLHTHSIKRYFGRMLFFAVVSEVPFDWAFWGTPFHWKDQNVFWTLALGLLALALIQHSDGGNPTLPELSLVGLCALAAQLMQTDYGAAGVLLIVSLYVLRDKRENQCAALILLTLYEVTAPLAAIPVWFYTGERGKCGKLETILYYSYYPAHLLLLGLLTNLVIIK